MDIYRDEDYCIPVEEKTKKRFAGVWAVSTTGKGDRLPSG